MKSESITVEKIIKNAKINNLKELDLRYTNEEFDEIPSELFNLTNLESLILGNKFNLKSIPKELIKLKKLKRLEISGTFEEFPLILSNLTNLASLTLISNSLKIIPKEIESWTTITYLNLGQCINIQQINGLPSNLTYIYLNGKSQNKIPESIYTLKYLNKIVLASFKLKAIPRKIFELQNIRSFLFSDSNLTSLPKEILNFKHLHELWLDGNKFKKFPEILFEIPKLRRLILKDNLLEKLPDELYKLYNLHFLDLGSNNFKTFPVQVFSLKNLTELKFGNYMHHNSTSKNTFTSIPIELLKLEKIKILNLFQIEIDNIPIEIIKEGIEAIKNYLKSKLEADEEEYLYEAKMVVVGRGDVGKSVLTKKLTIPNYSLSESTTTKGIDILKNPWEFKMDGLKNSSNFRFNIWDFGGQEKYDATHQLFITNRSVYLFLTEARAESNYQDIFYWLNTIRLLSYNSPIIVILSKCDERKKILPQNIYKEQFPNIVNFIDVSCADGYEYSIENLKASIADAVTLLPQTKLTLSNHWINIRKKLEQLSQNHDYIDYSEYLEICKNNKLDKKRADFLSEYLNDLGVIIHHKHDLLLKKTVFINTDWCVDGMYKVLDNEFVFQNKGKFTNDDLEKIWEDDRFANKQPELIRLMQDYGLCFEISDKSAYIAPDLLLPDMPEELDWIITDNLLFEYQYTFMPTGMISRFIVKAHNFIKNNLFWKYGVILKYDDTEALVQEDYINSKIKISLRGNNKKGLLSAIKMFVEEVHKDFDKDNKLVFEEMIPCNCPSCITSPIPHFYKFNVLKKFEQKPILEIPCEKSSEIVKIKNLINDVQLQSIENQIITNKDLQDFIVSLLNNVLDKEIKLKQGNINFWRDQKCSIPKDEVEVQPYISNTLDTLCKIKGINLAREIKEGNGNVDIVFSYNNIFGEILKVCVEIKKAHHSDIENAIKNQLPVYLDSAGTNAGIYIVIWYKGTEFNQPTKYKTEDELMSLIQVNNPDPENIFVKILNCSKQISPSKIKGKK
ncbi:COR domain-containing protein [Flavobacterium chilense]|uniref:Small GTP-binding protein domain-containing protein n=1 Tax=Flavobacterium chilense TaxID=946677 RepID=A0A1M6YKD0_9FLAO|nr:COR domain-containing protein [Flavobacterium chilense]SHL18764.1 small GTP-binding protein domain-containing protein [Flavobacterium chilense]